MWRSRHSPMSGSAASAMLKTLEALGLIDGSGKPTHSLRNLLAHSRGSPEFQAQTRKVLEHTYPYLFTGSINLKTATTQQVQNAFRAQDVSGSTVSKCIAFFLSAGKTAGVEISKYVRTGRIASRNFLTGCLMKILTISAQCGLTPQASEAPIPLVAISSGPSRHSL